MIIIYICIGLFLLGLLGTVIGNIVNPGNSASQPGIFSRDGNNTGSWN